MEVPGPGGVGHQDFLWCHLKHRQEVLGHCCTPRQANRQDRRHNLPVNDEIVHLDEAGEVFPLVLVPDHGVVILQIARDHALGGHDELAVVELNDRPLQGRQGSEALHKIKTILHDFLLENKKRPQEGAVKTCKSEFITRRDLICGRNHGTT